MGQKVKRLFASFRPESYELSLNIDKQGLTFTGSVHITGRKTGTKSKRLTLHQKDLKVIAGHVTRYDKKGESQVLRINRINTHGNFDEVRLHLEQDVLPGKYKINLEFAGKITKSMHGLYPCFFKHQNQPKQLLATQFESHHAREVFPCIDEPEAKATFKLTVASPKSETILSNTPIKSQRTKNGQQITEFEKTPIMSTYLLAFVVGELNYKEAATKSGTIIRTYATPDNVEFTEFALDTAVKCLEFYNEYFDIPYPLAKCDLVALPDFASGAMENWGLITYREQAVLVDPLNSTLGNKQWVAMVVAHELAHQWFGNLVTMRWWTDLWLNEGFASWIEYLAIDYIYPEWNMWTQFIANEQQSALKLDALQHTHPVEVPVRHPDEIRSIFDTISYNKGASIIHMLHGYLGAKVFKEGLRHYLKKHSYSNTDTIDLWSSLEEVSKRPIKDFMHAWTSQAGFPLVKVSTNRMSQSRFYINPKSQNNNDNIWPVPLLSDDKSLPNKLSVQSLAVDLNKSDFIKINRNQAGFYRSVYDKEHLLKLFGLIRSGGLNTLDRLAVLSDAFEAAKAGHLNTIDGLKVLEEFINEEDHSVWEVIASNIGSLRLVMDDEDLRQLLKPFIVKLTKKQLKRLGWDVNAKDSHSDKLLRPTVLGMAAAADEHSTVNTALEKFQILGKLEDVHPDVRGVVYTTAARKLNDEKTFNKLVDLYRSTTLSEEHTTLAAGITHFENTKLIRRSLELINSDLVKPQDIAYWVVYSFRNRFARQMTWQWLNENWQWLDETIGGDLSFYRFPIYAANVFSTKDFLKQFKGFFEPRSNPALERSIKQGEEILEWHIAWRDRDLQKVIKFFKAK